MVELYNRALLRDVPYSEWSDTQPQIAQAISDLKACGAAYQGTKADYSAKSVSRSRRWCRYWTAGLAVYVAAGANSNISMQQLRQPLAPDVDFMWTTQTYLSCQSGTVLESTSTVNLPKPRLILTPRDGVSSVHSDYPVSWAQSAVATLLGLGCPYGPLNPFTATATGSTQVPAIPNEFNFIDMGQIDCMDLIARAVRLVMNAAWYYKWHYFRLRPENAAYLVHLNKTNNMQVFKDCPKISDVILKSAVLGRVYQKQSSYLLSQAYPEGCPLHCSTPCGHCTFAAASLTIVKAFFDGAFLLKAQVPNAAGDGLMPYPAQPGLTLRVDQELNKSIFNIAFWRDQSGVHYLSDSLLGAPLGEQIAISVLRDCVQRYAFAAGFKFNDLNGQVVSITNFDQFPILRKVGMNLQAEKASPKRCKQKEHKEAHKKHKERRGRNRKTEKN